MLKNLLIVLAAAVILALPFIFKKEKPPGEWKYGDPVLVVISPHIAVIRNEFETGFSDWHFARYGKPVKIDWRAIGGTTEIMRYINGEFISSFRAYRKRENLEWPAGAGETATSKYRPADENLSKTWDEFRKYDNPEKYGIMIDVFFGGGTYDHSAAYRQGLTVTPWAEEDIPQGLVTSLDGIEMIPEARGGEEWRGAGFYSAALSGFGICCNPDRLQELGIEHQPVTWHHLEDTRYFGELAVTDPTKSGSIAKAFEMIIHSECRRAVLESGWTSEQIYEFEKKIQNAKLPPGVMPDDVPQKYQQDIEEGWLEGIKLIQKIGANARYFTEAAGKVPVDVSSGNAAAGVSIDFYSRVQAEVTYDKVNAKPRLLYVTPKGGSSISGDPISLLRGAPNRELGCRFIEYVLSEEGQKLWNYRPGTPGGPKRSALRRLPVRRDFYADPEHHSVQARAEEHAQYTSDDLLDPAVDAYYLAGAFDYQFRWTGHHFAFFRQLVKAMCMDSGVELREAWKSIIDAGGPGANPDAVKRLERLPDEPIPITWTGAIETMSKYDDPIDYMPQWTIFFRNSYRNVY